MLDLNGDFLLLCAIAAAVAALVTNALIPVVIRVAVAAGAVDRPTERRRDARSLPRLGGLAMGLGIAAACGVGAIARWSTWSGVLPRVEIAALVVGCFLVFVVGIADDLVGTRPWQKLFVQIVAAALVVEVGWTFDALRLPGFGQLELGAAAWLVSVVWVVGVTNAINLLDGLDGLAGGVAAIVASSLLVYSIAQGNEATAIVLATVVGACVGFLRHNWEPAKLFMGDSGSMLIGYLFGALTLHSALKAPAAVAILVPVLALGLPVIDTLLVMVVRFFEGEGRPLGRRIARIVSADRRHLHHRLEHLVRQRSRIVWIVYATAALFCVGALAVALSGDGNLGLALLAIEIAVVVAMRQLGLAAKLRRLSEAQREALRPSFPWYQEPESDDGTRRRRAR